MVRLVVALALTFCLTSAGIAQAAGGSWGKADEWADAFDVSGWAELTQSMRTQSPHDKVTSRARMRMELRADFDWLYGFLSLDAEKNWVIDDQTGAAIHEAWLEHTGDMWDLRVGRQVIIWGKADGLRITDNISPTDYTEPLTWDLDNMRLPVDAAKFRILGDSLTAEFIWIPVFRAATQPEKGSLWSVEPFPDSVRLIRHKADKPQGFSLKNSEFAMKLETYTAGFDVSVSVFYTWDDNPAMWYAPGLDEEGIFVDYTPDHRRLTIFGLDFSFPWTDFVFRGEAAFFRGRYLTATDGEPRKKNLVKYLLGVDWTPGNDWTVTAQITDDWIQNHESALSAKEHTPQVTLNVSKQFWSQTLTISNMTFFYLNDGEFVNRLMAEYEVMDGLSVALGWDHIHGDDGSYGMYRQNAQVWGRVRYSF